VVNYRLAVLLLMGLSLAVGSRSLKDDLLAQVKAETGESCAGVGDHAPSQGTPADVIHAWLQFHERELCQSLETAFKFSRMEAEVSCRIDDERSYERMKERFEHLRPAYPVKIYPTRPVKEKKSTEERREPPPSLWNNNELRIYLEDRSSVGVTSHEEASHGSARQEGEISLKQRMILFADQALEWDKRIRRYAEDLPPLMCVALNPSISEGLRRNAAAICAAHLLGIEKYAEKLEQNLSRALPKASKKSAPPVPEPPGAGASLSTETMRLAGAAEEMARRIDDFIYPKQYTVALTDLREPDLLDSLERLRRMIHALQDGLKYQPVP
jgi:hypothetical protein